MAALAIHIGRFLHGFALRAAVLLSVAYVATAIGMRALLVIGHWWLLSFGLVDEKDISVTRQLNFSGLGRGPSSLNAKARTRSLLA